MRFHKRSRTYLEPGKKGFKKGVMSGDKKYRVVFLGLLDSPGNFQEGMARHGVSDPVVDQIIQRAPVILKGALGLGDARVYADAVYQAGGRVNIQENGLFEEPMRSGRSLDIKPLERFTMCPECGYKQLKAEVCERCGFLLVERQTARD